MYPLGAKADKGLFMLNLGFESWGGVEGRSFRRMWTGRNRLQLRTENTQP